MDVCKAVNAYIERMIKEVQGMKMLLLDDHTVRQASPAKITDTYHFCDIYPVRVTRA